MKDEEFREVIAVKLEAAFRLMRAACNPMMKARGVISVAERQAYISRVRDLAKGACAAWMDSKGYAA